MPRISFFSLFFFSFCSALLAAPACSGSDGVAITHGPAPGPTSPGSPSQPSPSTPAAPTIPANGTAGCGATGLKSGAETSEIAALGDARRFVLTVPAGYDAYRAYPLVFVFHSGGGTGTRARDYFGFSTIAEDKAIFVYPDGHDGEWDLDTPARDNHDVAFFDALVEQIGKRACVDATRVFATGSSMGAYFANQLGCSRGDVLRAIAPHAGGGPYGDDSAYGDDGHLKCAGKPVAVMVFHGENDTNVRISDAEASIDHWSWANRCKSSTKPITPSPCVAYEGCAKPVVWCRLPGVGHRIWAEGPAATWQFFASF